MYFTILYNKTNRVSLTVIAIMIILITEINIYLKGDLRKYER